MCGQRWFLYVCLCVCARAWGGVGCYCSLCAVRRIRSGNNATRVCHILQTEAPCRNTLQAPATNVGLFIGMCVTTLAAACTLFHLAIWMGPMLSRSSAVFEMSLPPLRRICAGKGLVDEMHTAWSAARRDHRKSFECPSKVVPRPKTVADASTQALSSRH